MALYTIQTLYDIKRKDWYMRDDVDMESAKQQHRDNIEAIKAAQQWRERKNRPISIVVFHGSGRHPKISCANEMSNSQMLLERGLELALGQWEGPVEVDRHILREYILDPCNGCYSSAHSLCHFPCSCFPADDISTKIYPSIVKADILLFSTPINQSMVSSRIKLVLDRLISIDGGFHVAELPIKDSKYKEKMIELSITKPAYDARMHGKIAGYFVTSKDYANTMPEGGSGYPKEFSNLTYKDFVVGGVAHQGVEFGWFHAEPYYTMSHADPDVELSYDKEQYNKNTKDHERAKEVVLSSLELAKKFIAKPPKQVNPGRVNRS